MSRPDKLIYKYFKLCIDINESELEKIKKELDEEKVNPRDLKVRLAYELVKKYYDEGSAKNAREEFEKIFVKKGTPDSVPEFRAVKNEIKLSSLIKETGMSDSTSEANRLIKQGGVYIDGEKITDQNFIVKPVKDFILKVGKRKFLKIKF